MADKKVEKKEKKEVKEEQKTEEPVIKNAASSPYA